MSGLLSFFQKQGKTNMYKKAEKLVNKTHRNTSSGLKSVKRFFMGEGEMMKTYKMVRTLYESNDMPGLSRLKNTLEVEMPPFHSPKYEKQLQLIGYIDYLVKSKKANNASRTQMRNALVSSLNTSHEIGRLMKYDLLMENVPNVNNNSIEYLNSSPNNFITMPNGSVYTKEGKYIAGGRRGRGTRRRRGSN